MAGFLPGLAATRAALAGADPTGHEYDIEVLRHGDDPGTVFGRGWADTEGAVHGLPTMPPGTYSFRARTREINGAPLSPWGEWRDFGTIPAGETEPPYDETPRLEEMTMACCGSPDPAILEKNSRLFCRTCKRYLDVPPRNEDRDERDQTGDAGRGDDPDDR